MAWYFVASLALSALFTYVVKGIAARRQIVDRPDAARKQHPAPVPLWGGLAIWLSFWLPTVYLLWRPLLGVELVAGKLWAALLASAIIIVLGAIDDIKPLSIRRRLAVTAVAAGGAVVLGLGLERINVPGGVWLLPSAVGGGIVFSWLMGMMYTTKILDGLDGLATGIVTIGALAIFLFTQTARYYQPNVALLALILAGSCLGFLVWNFYPAKIFLGEAGSLFIGFMLGVLAVISGGKLAIAALVMAVPGLDLLRVIWRRHQRGQSIFQGDREHLHFQLVDRGFSVRQAVFLLYAIAAALGAFTLFLQSQGKVALLLVVVILMALVGWRLERTKPVASS
ncbi:MAG: undecaprenyl/decaprenyl-phosphate alpha-N-acetylglucosaminyl 1-phosphate transferase [Candidatus Magasanikbacteria bacterium]|nr:undecaprenyl/decaprenyl-phosphate alpha-N-acetylglucosaminyl 1-phosphate transferase [Candidatus Magasanikbacteria bacterium]